MKFHLRRIMALQGLTQTELARKMGKHRQWIQQLSSPDMMLNPVIKTPTIAALCRALDCQPGDLLTLDLSDPLQEG